MQISWSRTHIDVGIQTCLFQISILLSTLLSVKRKQLSLFDADFALTITSSPLTVYLVFASIADLFRFKTGLYKRVTHRHINRTLIIGVPLIWLGLSLTLSLSNDAFIGSQLCGGSTFTDWFNDQISFLQSNLILESYLFYYGLLPLFHLLLGLCLFRRWSLISTDVRSFWKRSNPWGRLLIPWVFVKCAWWVPVVSLSLAKPEAFKVYYQAQPRLVHILSVCSSRRLVDIPGYHRRSVCVYGI